MQEQSTAAELAAVSEGFVAVFPSKHSAQKGMQKVQEAAVDPSLVESVPGT